MKELEVGFVCDCTRSDAIEEELTTSDLPYVRKEVPTAAYSSPVHIKACSTHSSCLFYHAGMISTYEAIQHQARLHHSMRCIHISEKLDYNKLTSASYPVVMVVMVVLRSNSIH